MLNYRFFFPIKDQDIKDLHLSGGSLADVIPPGHNRVHAVLQAPGDMVDVAVVNSLRVDMLRMEQEAKQREADNKLFRKQILETIKEEKAATDARLQAQLESQNCLVANAILHQVTLFSFYIHV